MSEPIAGGDPGPLRRVAAARYVELMRYRYTELWPGRSGIRDAHPVSVEDVDAHLEEMAAQGWTLAAMDACAIDMGSAGQHMVRSFVWSTPDDAD